MRLGMIPRTWDLRTVTRMLSSRVAWLSWLLRRRLLNSRASSHKSELEHYHIEFQSAFHTHSFGSIVNCIIGRKVCHPLLGTHPPADNAGDGHISVLTRPAILYRGVDQGAATTRTLLRPARPSHDRDESIVSDEVHEHLNRSPAEKQRPHRFLWVNWRNWTS